MPIYYSIVYSISISNCGNQFLLVITVPTLSCAAYTPQSRICHGGKCRLNSYRAGKKSDISGSKSGVFLVIFPKSDADSKKKSGLS